jgi:hypothetical protein
MLRRRLRRFSVAMLAVVLVTPLGPSYGWEAGAGPVTHHDCVDYETDFSERAEGQMSAPQSHPVEHEDHGCVSHACGHLSILLHLAAKRASEADSEVARSQIREWRSTPLEGADRPPKIPSFSNLTQEPTAPGLRMDPGGVFGQAQLGAAINALQALRVPPA